MKRTNTAKWIEKENRWKIHVQKDGVRKSFYSSIKGRNGQREANAKADLWLDNSIENTNNRISVLLDNFLLMVDQRTSISNYKKEFYHVNSFIKPVIGNKKIDSLNEQNLQNILDKAYKRKDDKGEVKYLSKKTLENIRATIMSFLKFCRKQKLTTLFPEDLTIPAGARYKGKEILQPTDLIKLFTIDTTIINNNRVFDEYIYAYRFQVLTGLRPGELRGLEVEDIEELNVKIKRSINIYNEETKGKNSNAIRGYTMPLLARNQLDKQLELNKDSSSIFCINSTSTYRHRWQRFCESNGMSIISPYELRHTFVSVIKNLPEGKVKAIIGHSKDMDTFGTYGHEISGESNETAMEINDIFVKLLGSVVKNVVK